ncbi:MAG: hypothetical protein NC206_10650 [Bacteroides sp.]|nr:hypothetical protein [Roseburia sp.]MCM1347527.1 hypothetical protein [Bacteroides sp.]MCM1421995.1 hypothetical protein [Bacteroides sp.]
MIIERTQSADGGYRKMPVRQINIPEEPARMALVSYLQYEVFDCSVTVGK